MTHNSDFAKGFCGLIGNKACSVVFDNSKLKKAVPEFRPAVHFEEGISNTIIDAWCDKVISVLEKAKKEF